MPTPVGPSGITVSPDGTSVYVAAGFDNVYQFDVGSGGVLTPKNPASVSTGGTPFQIAISPDDKSVYVTSHNDGRVFQFDVGENGTLTPKTPASVSTGGRAAGVAVSPDGKSVYVASPSGSALFGAVFQFDAAQDGTLTPKTSASVAAGGSPNGIAVSPQHPTATSVSCTKIRPPLRRCTATVTDTATATKTMPGGEVRFTSSGAGVFSGNPCTLSGSGASASCSVYYASPPRPQTQAITATYSGDDTHGASSGSTTPLR